MDITNLIELETICLELKAQTKEQVLEELACMLEAAGKLNNKRLFLSDVGSEKRSETLGLTMVLLFHMLKVTQSQSQQSP